MSKVPKFLDEIDSIIRQPADRDDVLSILRQMESHPGPLPKWSLVYVANACLRSKLHREIVDFFLHKYSIVTDPEALPSLQESVVDSAFKLSDLASIEKLFCLAERKLLLEASDFDSTLAIVRAVWRYILLGLYKRKDTESFCTKALILLKRTLLYHDRLDRGSSNRSFSVGHDALNVDGKQAANFIIKVKRFCLYDADEGERSFYRLFLNEYLVTQEAFAWTSEWVRTLIRSCRKQNDVTVATFYYEAYMTTIKEKEDHQWDEKVLVSYCHVCNTEESAKIGARAISEKLRGGYIPTSGALSAINAVILKAKDVKLALKCIDALCKSWEQKRKAAIYSCLETLARLGYEEFDELLEYCTHNNWLGPRLSFSTLRLQVLWISQCLNPNKYTRLVDEALNHHKDLGYSEIISAVMLIHLRKPGKETLQIYKKAKNLGPVKTVWLMILLRWMDINYYSLDENDRSFLLGEVTSRKFSDPLDERSASYAFKRLSLNNGICHSGSTILEENFLVQKYDFLRNFSSVFEHRPFDVTKSQSHKCEEFFQVHKELCPPSSLKKYSSVLFHGQSVLDTPPHKMLLKSVLRRIQYSV